LPAPGGPKTRTECTLLGLAAIETRAALLNPSDWGVFDGWNDPTSEPGDDTDVEYRDEAESSNTGVGGVRDLSLRVEELM
jgi:hypothetical protein